MVSRKLASLFLLITVIGIAHMGEQLATGIEEYYMLREQIGHWQGLFPAEMAGEASVLLITMVFASVSLMLYALMRGGTPALAVVGLFGVLGVSETHHWVEALLEGGYDPGLVTSLAYVWVGVWILLEVWRLLRGGVTSRTDDSQ